MKEGRHKRTNISITRIDKLIEKEISGYQGLEGRRNGNVSLNSCRVSVSGDEKIWGIEGWLHNMVNVINATEW